MSQRPVRVLFVAASLCFGGAEKHAITLANRLDPAQFQLSFSYLKPDESLLPQLDVRRLKSVVSFKVSRKLDWSVVRALVRQIDADQIDVIVCVTEYPALYAMLAARRARRTPKLIEIFHTTTYRRLKESLQMILYRRLIRRFDALVFVSHKQREYWDARNLRARQVAVIQNGIDTDYFQDRYNPRQKAELRARFGFAPTDYVVGICAALRPEKAHGDLLQALSRLRERKGNGTAVKGLIIGDGVERARIESLIARLGLGEEIAMAGFHQDVRPLIACCDVMVLPSHAVETFSLAALEAMALGKPVVLSRIGGAEEQVIDGVNGLLFEAGDVGRLTERLAALEDPQLRERMSQGAVRRVSDLFDESRMVAAYSQLLSSIADQHDATAPRTESGLQSGNPARE
jgi:glycosyltransferase involved in cell wall biosynthesis